MKMLLEVVGVKVNCWVEIDQAVNVHGFISASGWKEL